MYNVSIIMLIIYAIVIVAGGTTYLVFYLKQQQKAIKIIMIVVSSFVLIASILCMLILNNAGFIGKKNKPQDYPTDQSQQSVSTGVSEHWDYVGTIYFGSYPQTCVNDSSLIYELNGLSDSYINGRGYYKYKGHEYAKLTATPYSNDYCFKSQYPVVEGENYWFYVEPICWRVFEKNDDIFYVADVILDTLAFDSSKSAYLLNNERIEPNNYEYSDIREWLNNEFCYYAFYSDEFNQIQSYFAINEDCYEDESNNDYCCNNTYDIAWLLSLKEVEEINYNRSSVNEYLEATDYSVAKGIELSHISYGYEICVNYSSWWLRSPAPSNTSRSIDYSMCANIVDYDGTIYLQYIGSSYGVRPVICLK